MLFSNQHSSLLLEILYSIFIMFYGFRASYFKCTFIYMCGGDVCMYVCVCVCLYVCMYACMYVCMYVRVIWGFQ
jgi:hypothetical protein